MLKISNLPAEILLEIGSQVSYEDHIRLHTVSKYLSGALAPLFFARFVLRAQEMHHEDSLYILDHFAAGKSGWSQWCRTLTIVPGDSGRAGTVLRSDTVMQHLLYTALSSMTKIRTARCVIVQSHPSWLRAAVWDCLPKFHLLQNLHLEIAGYVPFDLVGMTHLRQLKIAATHWLPHTPPPGSLQYRSFGTDGQGSAPTQPQRCSLSLPQQIAQLTTEGHRLTSLHVVAPQDPTLSMVWTELMRCTPAVRLRELTAQAELITGDFVKYFSSYSGMERLHLVNPERREVWDGETGWADAFYRDALGKHANTLVEFCCPLIFTTRWGFGQHNKSVISKLRKLERLEMGISGADARIDVNMYFSTIISLSRLHRVAIHATVPIAFRMASALSDMRLNAVVNIQHAIKHSWVDFSEIYVKPEPYTNIFNGRGNSLAASFNSDYWEWTPGWTATLYRDDMHVA